MLVIPEIGINHGGSLEVAKLMIDAAANAGAKIVKHQTHIVDDEMSHAAKHVIPGNSKKSIYDVMEECALSESEELEMMRYAESRGLVFMSTPFSRAAADRLEKFGVSAYKIGSGEMNNYPLIEHIADFGKPMIVSTGMNDIKSIEKTVNILERKNVKYALLHTTNIYPTKPEQVRLGAMLEMAEAFPDVPFGLSDHTLNNNSCIAAAALGATIFERHFTDSKSREGNDIVCSMDGHELSELIKAVNEVKLMRGGEKSALADEQVTIDFAFATVVSIKPVAKGDVFSKENIWVKRPGTGEIPAVDYPKILGKKAACNIPSDTHITLDMVEEV
ncbi:MAG: N-acetylneuraminate synthase family protein [Oscillospiraceae bacterium]|nr:N-acetylneuraminate synthase family protein [Oscillospiraceae bacterium]